MEHKALPLLQDMLAEGALWQDPRMPFGTAVAPGLNNVLVVAGDNCSGKSFLVETLRAWVRAEKLDSIVVSIRERTGGGLYEMASMRRAMMFGDETDQSTGAISAHVVTRAFSTLAGRAEENKASFLVLDEPELGLSESMAGALGEYIGQQALAMPSLAVGLAVVTHSRALVSRMTQALGQAPTFVHMREASCGAPAADLDSWLQNVPRYGVEDLQRLDKTNHTNRLLLSRMFDEMRKAPNNKKAS